MLDRRRGFLIGAGALLTGSFVKKANAFSRTARKPLILPHGQKARGDPLRLRAGCGASDDGRAPTPCGKWRVSLGPDQPFAPPPPTWREHLRSLGHPLDTQDEIERACRREHDLPLEELDVRLNGFGWEDSWDNFTGPQAKAHHLLKGPQSRRRGIGAETGWPDYLRGVRRISGQFLHLG